MRSAYPVSRWLAARCVSFYQKSIYLRGNRALSPPAARTRRWRRPGRSRRACSLWHRRSRPAPRACLQCGDARPSGSARPTQRSRCSCGTCSCLTTTTTCASTSAWSKCPLGGCPARLLHLLRVRPAALGSSALPGCGPATGRPATASGARASRLQSRRFRCLLVMQATRTSSRPWPSACLCPRPTASSPTTTTTPRRGRPPPLPPPHIIPVTPFPPLPSPLPTDRPAFLPPRQGGGDATRAYP